MTTQIQIQILEQKLVSKGVGFNTVTQHWFQRPKTTWVSKGVGFDPE